MMKMQINCNIAVKTAIKMGCKIPGIDSSQLLKGQKKAILAIVWQVVRFEYLKIIGSQSEKDLVEWANKSVGKEDLAIKSFRDKKLSDGRFLIDLCASLEPRAVNWDIVTPGETDEDKELNAKYAISIARMFGAVVFCIWEDIVACNQKMILVFVCSLHEIAM